MLGLAAVRRPATLPLPAAIAALFTDEVRRRRGLGNQALFAACALGFVAVAIPLQPDRQWIIVGWALEPRPSGGCTVACRTLASKYFGIALFAAVLLRLYPDVEFRQLHERGAIVLTGCSTPTACRPAASSSVPVACRPSKRPTAPLGGPARRWHAPGLVSAGLPHRPAGGVRAHQPPNRRRLLVGTLRRVQLGAQLRSRSHRLFGLGHLRAASAFHRHVAAQLRALRFVSLGFMLLTIAKVFLYDLSNIHGIYRPLSFLGLAVSLIVVSLLYQRFVFVREPQASRAATLKRSPNPGPRCPRNRSVSLAPSSVLRLAAVVGLFAVAAQSDAQRLPSDDSHGAFQKRRAISIADPGSAAPGSTFAAIALPPDQRRRRAPFRDLRLVRVGASAPAAGERRHRHLVEEQRGAVASAQFRGTLLDTRSGTTRSPITTPGSSTLAVAPPRPHRPRHPRARLRPPLQVRGRRAQGRPLSPAARRRRHLRQDLGAREPHRIHHTHLTGPCDSLAVSAYHKVIGALPAARVTVVGVTASRSEAVPARSGRAPPAEALPSGLASADAAPRRIAAIACSFPGLPIEGLTLAADDPAFARLVRVIEERPSSQRKPRAQAGRPCCWARVCCSASSARRAEPPAGPDSEVGGESLTLPLTAHPENGVLYVEIDASQGPPLSSLRFTVSGLARACCFRSCRAIASSCCTTPLRRICDRRFTTWKRCAAGSRN